MRTQDWESKKITKNVSFLKIKEGRILCWKAQIYGQWKRFDSPKMMEWLEHILVLNALFPWMLTEVAGEKFPVRIVKCEWEERRGWKWGLVRTRLRPCGLLDFSDGCFYFKSEKWKILSVDVFFRKLLFSFFVLVILLCLLTIFLFFF